MKSYSDIDSKFRFVILAVKRAKELLGGAKPKIKSKSKNPIRIAQNEVSQGLIDFEIIQPKEEEVIPEEGVFIGEKVKEEVKVKEEKKVTKEKKKEIEEKKEKKKKAKKKAEPRAKEKPKVTKEKPKAAKEKKKK